MISTQFNVDDKFGDKGSKDCISLEQKTKLNKF